MQRTAVPRLRACAALLLLAWLPPLLAHQPTPAAQRAEPDPLPAALAGVQLQVLETLAPQLVLENRSGKLLEILDDRGRAFLRIGPAGVEADHHASAWYVTYSTAPSPIPAAAQQPDAAPRWISVHREPNWGWFDPRVNPVAGQPGHHDAPAAKPAAPPKTRWEIPVRIAGEPALIRGRFVAKPQPRGRFEAQVLGSDLPEAAQLTLAQGRPPALFLRHAGATPLTVLGIDNEPYLRIGKGGVELNLASETFRLYGRQQSLVATDAKAPVWRRVSSQPAYTWLEPRAGYPALEPPARIGQRHEARRWVLPMLLGERPLSVEGRTEWVPEMAGH